MREGKRFGTGRFGLPRVLTALVLFLATLGGALGAGRGAQCARRSAMAVSAAQQQSFRATDLHHAATKEPAPAQDGSPPTATQGCASSIALPVFAILPEASALTQAPPLERVAALVAMHEPPTLFRPPRVI